MLGGGERLLSVSGLSGCCSLPASSIMVGPALWKAWAGWRVEIEGGGRLALDFARRKWLLSSLRKS